MSDPAYRGTVNPQDIVSEFAERQFQIKSSLLRMAGATIVQVMAVHPSTLTVDIMPMVNMVDGFGNAIPHGTIFNCPYFRLQTSNSAIIADPTKGDIGIAVFADRDISSVIANRAVSNPGSARIHDMSDGLYFGGILNSTPTQFVQFNSAGITVTSPVTVTVNAPIVSVNAATSAAITSPLISLGASGASLVSVMTSNIMSWLNTHVHSNGNAGANTGVSTVTAPASALTTTVKVA